MSTEGMSPKEAARILMQAEEIKQDAELMAQVGPIMHGKKKDVKKILSLKELRKVANEKGSEPPDDESETEESDVAEEPEPKKKD
jgi:hypothetical protein